MIKSNVPSATKRVRLRSFKDVTRHLDKKLKVAFPRKTKRRNSDQTGPNNVHSITGDQRLDGGSQSDAPRVTQSVMVFPLPPD